MQPLATVDETVTEAYWRCCSGQGDAELSGPLFVEVVKDWAGKCGHIRKPDNNPVAE